MSLATVAADLEQRLTRYRDRYHASPETLPVTLDELAWLGEWCAAGVALATGAGVLLMPIRFAGIPLQLVATVQELPDGAIGYRR